MFAFWFDGNLLAELGAAWQWPINASVTLLVVAACVSGLIELFGLRFIPNNRVGIVEKLWSSDGSVPTGHLIALDGEAGFQAEVLRGGFHIGLWRWQYRIHRLPLIVVPQRKMAYVYARDGQSLDASQTLARVVDSDHFQNARQFLAPTADSALPGQRGRQRAVLREGVYAVNLALFTVITECKVYELRLPGQVAVELATNWQQELLAMDGFSPIVVGGPASMADPLHPDRQLETDSIGIVTVHDGPALAPGEIIAPAVGMDPAAPNHHYNFQDPEAFLAAGGRRGRQYVPLTDGTYFINRWFAQVDLLPKTVVPIGYVGVVVSYYGHTGQDVSGTAFRHGERVAEGQRGVWAKPLGPGKYPFNVYAGAIILVPTTNFVLHWVTGKSESHRYDESLRSIDLVTKDAYEPLLPLSVVVHIDYERAPSVIQRFGDVQKLITQTLDPMLSAYFRDVAHKKTMLQLLHERDAIQLEARQALSQKFREFDIECVDVLIGKPDTEETHGKIETLLEQLRQRQLATEQQETYDRQRAAADRLRMLNEAQALSAKQAELTNSRVQVQIAENEGDASLARARKQAQQTVVTAEAEGEANLLRARKQAEQIVVTAEAESRQRMLQGRGEGTRALQVGLSEVAVLLQKVRSFGDPRLFALSLAAQHLAHSTHPLVPERVFVMGGDGQDGVEANSAQGLLGTLLGLLVAEKSGLVAGGDATQLGDLDELAQRLTRDAVKHLADEHLAGDVAPGETAAADSTAPSSAGIPSETAPVTL